jgi:ATP-binding cassette subfamily F protein uup
MEAELAALHETMADPAFYKQDRDAIARINARLQALEADLAAGYERWEALDAIGG